MSIEIIDQRLFLQTPNYIVPMILHGSNNCTEYVRGREVREKYWSVYFSGTLITREEFKSTIEIFFPEDVAPDIAFKYNGKLVCTNQLQNWFKTGAKNVTSIEKVLACNPWTKLKASLSLYCEDGTMEEELCDNNIKTTDQLDDWLLKASIFRTNLLLQKRSVECYFNLSFTGRYCLKIFKDYKVPVKAKLKKRNRWDKERFVTEVTENSMSSGPEEQALIFKNTEEAIEQLKPYALRYYDIRIQKA